MAENGASSYRIQYRAESVSGVLLAARHRTWTGQMWD